MQLHYIEDLLGLKGVVVKAIHQHPHCWEITLHATAKTQCCPHCAAETAKIHDYRFQRIQHVAMGLHRIVLRLRKRRFACPHCLRSFAESYDFVGRYQRRTKQQIAVLLKRLKDTRSLCSIAKEQEISGSTLQRTFQGFQPPKPMLPRVLCMDEFKGNAGGEKYQMIMVDGVHKKILDILPSRKQREIVSYFQEFSLEERKRVTYVVMDMCRVYADIAKAYFPNAVLVVDKFHFARQCFWALENVRKKCQQHLTERLRKYFKRSKSLLRKRADKLTPDQRQQVESMLWYDEALRDAYVLKEAYYAFLQAGSQKEAAQELDHWLALAKSSGLKEFHDCIRAHTNWREEILAHFSTGLTNGRTEGFNNKIKVIKRVSYGYRNFENLRRRILYGCS